MIEVEDDATWAAGPLIVYELRFEDGTIYVGQTGNLDKRLANHAGAWRTNRLLAAKMSSGVGVRCHIVWRCDDRQDALDHETELIAMVPPALSLNIARFHTVGVGSNRSGGPRRYGRIDDDRMVVCSWCRELLPARMYHTDRSRSTGIASRCEDCTSVLHRERRVAIERGSTAGEGYARAKSECSKR